MVTMVSQMVPPLKVCGDSVKSDHSSVNFSFQMANALLLSLIHIFFKKRERKISSIVISLKDFIDGAPTDAEREHRCEALSSFQCAKDKDIENFLQQKALNFLNRGWCAIYLILDEEALNQQEFKILAYFTLSHKTLIPEQASKTKVKTVTKGFQHAESIHFVLIGQLGKHIEKLPDGTFKGAAISSQEILDYAFEIIEESNELIPCRCV